MRAKLLAAMIVALSAASSGAQPDPVLAHFTAYRTAFEANDLATAEREAALALAASEERNGRRTGVLALNLATVRLERNDAAGALQPAQRALALAQAGAAGLDPNLAELVMGRVELGTQGAPGALRLTTILEGPNLASLQVDQVYSAASALAKWHMEERDYAPAQRMWRIAADYAEGSTFGAVYAHGRARTAEAASMILQQVGATGSRPISNITKQEVYDLLAEAIDELGPLANRDNPTGGLTFAQRAYADALAWRGLLIVKLRSQGDRVPTTPEAQGDEMSELGSPAPLARPCCRLEKLSGSMPSYPRDMLNRSQMGVVILRIRLDETGAVTEAITAAHIGNDDFPASVERAARTWRIGRRAGESTDCRIPTTVLVPVNFVLD